MKFNAKATQHALDKAAAELEEFGYVDLADKIDHYNDQLVKNASNKKVRAAVGRGLSRVYKEALRRYKESKGISTDKPKKASLDIEDLKRRNAIRKARLAKLKAKKDKRNAPTKDAHRQRIESLYEARKRRLAKESRRYSNVSRRDKNEDKLLARRRAFRRALNRR